MYHEGSYEKGKGNKSSQVRYVIKAISCAVCKTVMAYRISNNRIASISAWLTQNVVVGVFRLAGAILALKLRIHTAVVLSQ